jgi:hypothetical protein
MHRIILLVMSLKLRLVKFTFSSRWLWHAKVTFFMSGANFTNECRHYKASNAFVRFVSFIISYRHGPNYSNESEA